MKYQKDKDFILPKRNNNFKKGSISCEGKLWYNETEDKVKCFMNNETQSLATEEFVKQQLQSLPLGIEALNPNWNLKNLVDYIINSITVNKININFKTEVDFRTTKCYRRNEELDSEVLKNLKEKEIIVSLDKETIYFKYDGELRRKQLKATDSFLCQDTKAIIREKGDKIELPSKNDFIHINSEGITYNFNGENWVKAFAYYSHNELNGLQGGDTKEHYHLSKEMYSKIEDVTQHHIAKIYRSDKIRIFNQVIIEHNLNTKNLIIHVQADQDGTPGALLSGYSFHPLCNNKINIISNIKRDIWVTVLG